MRLPAASTTPFYFMSALGTCKTILIIFLESFLYLFFYVTLVRNFGEDFILKGTSDKEEPLPGPTTLRLLRLLILLWVVKSSISMSKAEQ